MNYGRKKKLSAVLVLSWILTLIIAFELGYFLRSLTDRIRIVMLAVGKLISERKSKDEPGPEGKVVEPTDDPVGAARREFEERSNRLNR